MTVIRHTNMYNWFRALLQRQEEGHTTVCADDPASRTVGWEDSTADEVHVLGLVALKERTGDPYPEGAEFWEPYLHSMKTSQGRRTVLHASPHDIIALV